MNTTESNKPEMRMHLFIADPANTQFTDSVDAFLEMDKYRIPDSVIEKRTQENGKTQSEGCLEVDNQGISIAQKRFFQEDLSNLLASTKFVLHCFIESGNQNDYNYLKKLFQLPHDPELQLRLLAEKVYIVTHDPREAAVMKFCEQWKIPPAHTMSLQELKNWFESR